MDLADRGSYYRTLQMAQTVAFEDDPKLEHVTAMYTAFEREFAKLDTHPKVVRARSLRNSFEEFGTWLSSMDVRDYAFEGLKSLAVEYKGVLDATKKDMTPTQFDAAVSGLFASAWKLVPIGPLRISEAKLGDFLKKNPGLAKRWNVSGHVQTLEFAREVMRSPKITKEHVRVIAAKLDRSFAKLEKLRDDSAKLDRLLARLAHLHPSSYSKPSWKKATDFAERAVAERHPDNAEKLLSEGEYAIFNLIDVSLLKASIIRANSVLETDQRSNRDF